MENTGLGFNHSFFVEYNGKKYLPSDGAPKDGDLVLTERHGVWEFKQAPCPPPYWGNADACKKLVLAQEINTIKESSLLPAHYEPECEPNYKGAGEHSVRELEAICEQYKELVHQLRIREQSILLASGLTIVK